MSTILKMKDGRLLGIVWILFAFYDFYWGGYYLYQYSTPDVLWILMIPISTTYSKILIGVLALTNGISILRDQPSHLTYPLTLLPVLYILIDFSKTGIVALADSGSNILLLALALFTLKQNNESATNVLQEIRQSRTLLFIVIGLTPYILSYWISYDWFDFLH